MTKPIARDPIYRRRRFDAEIIELCVLWYITTGCQCGPESFQDPNLDRL
jgi:hypothetical protein